jgi:hypothetical protein
MKYEGDSPVCTSSVCSILHRSVTPSPVHSRGLIILYTIFFVLSGRVKGSWRPVKCGIRAAPNRFAGLRVPEEHWIRLPGKHGIQRATSSADNDNVSSKKLP